MAKNTVKHGLLLNEKFDSSILIITLLLLAIGLIMLLSASTPTSMAESKDGNPYTYVTKQGIMVVVGLFALFAVSKIDYRIYRKLKWFIYIFFVILLFVVGFIGTESHGARRWINIMGFSFQPSEFAKVGFIIFYASLLSDLKEKNLLKKPIPGFIYPLIFFIPIVLAVYKKQNHFSATFIMGVITIVQMFVAGSSLKAFFTTGGIGLVGVIIYLFKGAAESEGSGFRGGRISTWLDLNSDLTGTGWQINQSLYAIGSGGLFGLGLGNSKQKYLYLPEPQNDFIFSVLAEELGFVGCVIVIILFVLFIWRGIVIALRADDLFGTLIAIGVTTLIGLEAMINIAVVTNTVPVTGMPLPFFSYGGSAMLANLIAVGVLLSVSRNRKKKEGKI